MRFAVILVLFFVARDAPARALPQPGHCSDATLAPAQRLPRVAEWAIALAPVVVESANTRAKMHIRLYGPDGEIDETARADFERVVSNDGELHPLSPRVEQLVFKAAYHFNRTHVIVVSAFRPRASRHGTGEAVDFKLEGVRAWQLAAYLRGLSRAGVGIYTNPNTQFVHVDVRDQSYHWVDASPPGIKLGERQMGDKHAKERDEAWTPELDLPS